MGTLAWHFIAREGVLRDGSPTADVERYSGSLELRESGLHASVRPIDALRYAPGAIVRRVECSGDVIHGDDKLVCTERRVLWTRDATATLHEFALWCAEQAIDREERAGRKVDPRSREAIAVKRAWLRGDATDEQLAAARYAARAAAMDAAMDAARDAAWAAAMAAARDAARDAARAAAMDAAMDAAWDAARDAQNAELERRLLALGES